MQHDRPGSQPEEGGERSIGQSNAELSAQIRFLEDEVALLRRKISESPRHTRLLEQRLAEASERVSQLTERARRQAEAALHSLGFHQVRVRHHGDLARIEISREELPRALSLEAMDSITAALRPLGFLYITLDTQGYRSGSMKGLAMSPARSGSFVSGNSARCR